MTELEDMVENSRYIGLGRRIVHDEALFMQLHKIRAALPEDLKEAERVARDREKLIGDASEDAQRMSRDARAEAERILREANEKRQQLIAENEITLQALREAEEIKSKAEEEAASTRGAADSYARDVLSRLDTFIAKISQSIAEGRRSLDEPRQASGERS